MKKFLSILLAVMMVLSTVSFAAPSLAGTVDSAVEMPVLEEVAPEEAAADLAADTVDEFGTLLAEVNFNSATPGAIDFGSGLLASALGGSVTSASNTDLASFKVTNGSGDNYPALGAVVKEKTDGDKYVEFTTNAAGNKNLIQLYTGSNSKYFTTEDGYLTVTFDAYYGDSAANGQYFDVAFNRSQQAEAHDLGEVSTVAENGGWGKVIATFDEEIGLSGNGGNSATMLPSAVNYAKIHTAGSVVEGETFGIDNIRVYYRPKTVDVTIYVDGENDVVLNDYDTLGMDFDELAALLPDAGNNVLVGFSLEENGELLYTTKFASDCTIYPVYEERVALEGSIEFNSASDSSKYSLRTGKNNDLGANFAQIKDGSLVFTFTATDTSQVVQDTGITNIPVNFPADALSNIEIRARFTGMPTETTTLTQAGGGTRTYNPASVNFPQLYFTTGGAFSTYGEKIVSDLTNANGNWMIFNYTVEELGITDLTTFRFDFYDYMPHGSTLEIDYIRFIGKPVRVTVDNGKNATAPEVVMDITASTTVAEVEAKYAKDHGDMKFLGLSRTKGGTVLSSSELVSLTGASTTLYAVWEDYEYLTKYSVDFNEETDVTKKVRLVQNSDGVEGNSTYGTTYFWNKEGGYLTLKAIADASSTATWDHQVYVETFNADTALPAGVVSEIAVRMRYRNIPAVKTTYTITGRANTDFNPVKNDAFVHIGKYGATKWGDLLQSNNRFEENLVDGEWFTRYLDADTYFKEGLSYVRFDTAYPMPAGAEVDIDYIRFVGDNDNANIPGAEFIGQYGEKVWSVDFDDATTGTLANSTQAATLGLEENSWLSTATEGIRFASGANGGKTAPTVAIAEKSATDKYFTYTLNDAGSYNYFFFSSGNKNFVAEDGYFIVTLDYKANTAVPFTFRINKHDLVEDGADNIQIIENGEWDTAVIYYDAEIGTSRPANGNFISSTNEISIVKWHPTGDAAAVGTTVSIDNVTLWYVPKTVKVTVDLSAYGVDNAVISDYPTDGMDRAGLEKAVPAVKDREITGISLVSGGEALYQNRVAYDATVYPVYEKVKVLDHTLEFNSAADIAKISAMGAASFRLGRNNALTFAEQFVVEQDTDGTSYLRMRNQSLAGENGLVIDYGFWTSNTLVPSEIKEVVMKIRIPEWAAQGTYTGDDRAPTGNFNPQNMVFQFYCMSADGSTVYHTFTPSFNAVTLDGEWFTYTIPGSEIPADTKLIRFDTPDFIAHGTTVDVDYIRFYGYPEPDNESLSYSAEFNENVNGVSLNAWMKADGTYMFDDGVNGDKGPGIGSKYITEGAEGYITWNADGYVTLNFDANDEVKAAAAAQGKTAAVYDPSIYVSALDKSKYIPAGAFEEIKIRMRLRGLPADGTEVYAMGYSGYTSATFSMAKYPVYFHWMNSRDAVLYEGVQSKHFDDTCTFTQGSYVANQWFEVTIPASFFEADVEDLATLRINLPDWTPDGTKIDIDYIRFMGQPPEVDAPTSVEDATDIRIVEGKENGLRFKATVSSATDIAAADLGFVVVSYDKFMADNTSYDDLTVDTTGVKVGYKRLEGEDLVNYFNTDDDEALEMAAVLYGIPEAYYDSYVIVRPFACVAGAYYYGAAFSTSLYDEAVEIYEDTDTFDNLSTEQQDYIIYVLDTVEL